LRFRIFAEFLVYIAAIVWGLILACSDIGSDSIRFLKATKVLLTVASGIFSFLLIVCLVCRELFPGQNQKEKRTSMIAGLTALALNWCCAWCSIAVMWYAN
jgi:hypothetical protein